MHIFLVSRLVQMIVFHHKRRQTIQTLNALSDDLLKDIGIERNQIYAATDALIANTKEKRVRLDEHTTRALEDSETMQSICVKPVTGKRKYLSI